MKVAKVAQATTAPEAETTNSQGESHVSTPKLKTATTRGATNTAAPKTKTDKNRAKTDSEKTNRSQSKKTEKTKNQPEPLVLFQMLEWHALTLAGTKMDEAAKKERLTVIVAELNEIALKLKTISMKKYGVSQQTVDHRLELTTYLVDQILKSDQRYEMSQKTITNGEAAMHFLNNYEACEWKLLEQGQRAKDAAKNQNLKRRESEQAGLFKAAEHYCGASTSLAEQSEKIGIPKDIVKLRSEQRLKEMGEDPDLKDMRNPSNSAAMITGSAAFMYFVKELIEKLAKAIKEMVLAAKQKNVSENVPAAPTQTSVARPS